MPNITANILAGGLGMRLRPAVSDRPKVLAEINGRPFLTYLLDILSAAGITGVVICTGYMGNRVEKVLGNSYRNLQIRYSSETKPLGTAGALRLSFPMIKSDPVLVMNGDSLCEVNLQSFHAWHCKQGAKGSLVLTKVLNTNRYGHVFVDGDGVVLAFSEKRAEIDTGWINAGVYLLSQRLLLTIPCNEYVSLERDMFPLWVGRGIYGYLCEGRFIDIGTPESYFAAKQIIYEMASRNIERKENDDHK